MIFDPLNDIFDTIEKLKSRCKEQKKKKSKRSDDFYSSFEKNTFKDKIIDYTD